MGIPGGQAAKAFCQGRQRDIEITEGADDGLRHLPLVRLKVLCPVRDAVIDRVRLQKLRIPVGRKARDPAPAEGGGAAVGAAQHADILPEIIVAQQQLQDPEHTGVFKPVIPEIAAAGHIVHQGRALPGLPADPGREVPTVLPDCRLRPGLPVSPDRRPERVVSRRVAHQMDPHVVRGKEPADQIRKRPGQLLRLRVKVRGKPLQKPVIADAAGRVGERRALGKEGACAVQRRHMAAGGEPVPETGLHLRHDLPEPCRVGELRREKHLPHGLQRESDLAVQHLGVDVRRQSDLPRDVEVRIAVHPRADASAVQVDEGRKGRVITAFRVDIPDGVPEQGETGKLLRRKGGTVEDQLQISDAGGEDLGPDHRDPVLLPLLKNDLFRFAGDVGALKKRDLS